MPVAWLSSTLQAPLPQLLLPPPPQLLLPPPPDLPLAARGTAWLPAGAAAPRSLRAPAVLGPQLVSHPGHMLS